MLQYTQLALGVAATLQPLKSMIKASVRKLGYEIVPIPVPGPVPGPRTTEAPLDEEIPGPWDGGVLQMSNQYYRPARLEYFQTVFGDDQRLKYILFFLDLRQQRVLEIGPHEAHNSIVLEKMGVRETISIECRDENLKKCNRIKKKYRLDNTVFLKHDLERLYASQEQPQFSGPFDLVFCLGVLYHVPDPAQALIWMRQQSKTLFLGTHLVSRDGPAGVYTHNGKTYRGKWHHEDVANPMNGMSEQAFIPYEEDLIEMLRDAGYLRISILGRDVQNRTAHITILAE